ncbi:conserved hypothetical protein [Candidatus Sulfopaludibacter sp. SbA3]|nr:conserved hypothetical protein [Candidatus Sulfopaludibacter sp. SbA3]
MKPFRFSLERVLAWRQNQLGLEEARLEQLRGQLAATEQTRRWVLERRVTEQTAVAQSTNVAGEQLMSLERLRVWTLREEGRLTARMAEMARAIQVQEGAVNEARRRVRLVERLKERKHENWRVETDRELDTMAGEFAVAQWRRAQD